MILPACAAQCVAANNSTTLKLLANETLTCVDYQLNRIELCVSATCTIKEALAAKNITEGICNLPLRNRTATISVISIVGVSLASLAALLRLLSRIKSRKPGMDDWTIIAAMGFVIPLSAMAVVLANHGLGKDIWSLSFEDITYIQYIYYFSEILYLGSQMLIRVSILCLYLRMFSHGALRQTIHAIMVANLLYGTSFMTASIFQCIPIRAAWTGWDGTVKTNCINANAVGWISAIINIILDAFAVVLPLPELAKLKISREQKIQVFVMFSLGSLVTIVSILRLTSLVKFANTHNITWDYVPVGYWSSIEVHVSLICACLPTIPSLFRKRTSNSRQIELDVSPGRLVRKPKIRDSDILPLLKMAHVSEHRGAY